MGEQHENTTGREEYPLSTVERALLDHIADEDVTRNGRSFRLWHSETEYGLVTAVVRRLVAEGLAAVEHTYHDRGIVRLTEAGRAVRRG